MSNEKHTAQSSEVTVQAGNVGLDGLLTVPENSTGIVVFAHGSGSSRFSSRNQYVARVLNEGGLATLLFDLLTAAEHEIDVQTRELRFDIDLLSERVIATIDWLSGETAVNDLPIGLFGASTGAAAALNAAAERPARVATVVSRGGLAEGPGANFADCWWTGYPGDRDESGCSRCP